MTSSAALPVSLDSERIARFEHISDIVAVAKTYLVVMMAILIWDTLAMLPTERRFIWRVRCAGLLWRAREADRTGVGALDSDQGLLSPQVCDVEAQEGEGADAAVSVGTGRSSS